MAIKKLQNDFTTPEQSKRLLELGVPADSANCCLRRILTDGGYCETWRVDVFDFIGQIHDDYLPCWSAGRLMEICDICILAGGGKKGEFYFDSNGINKTYVQDLVDTIEGMLKLKLFDFSKLED